MAGLDGARIRRGAFMGGARGREGEDEKLRGRKDMLQEEQEKNLFFIGPEKN